MEGEGRGAILSTVMGSSCEEGRDWRGFTQFWLCVCVCECGATTASHCGPLALCTLAHIWMCFPSNGLTYAQTSGACDLLMPAKHLEIKPVCTTNGAPTHTHTHMVTPPAYVLLPACWGNTGLLVNSHPGSFGSYIHEGVTGALGLRP